MLQLTKHLKDNYTLDELKDLSNFGAQNGFGDFVYYTDTTKYFEQFKDDCFAAVNDYNEETGFTGFPAYVNVNASEYHLFANSMIWFAIEYIARDIVEGGIK